MEVHAHEMKRWKSIPDFCSWVWIPIQGHLWRHSEVRESKRHLNKIERRFWLIVINEVARGVLVYVYVYTDGEPPSQLTVSFGLLGGVVSTDNPITVRSQSDLQSDHSPITVRSYVLLPFHITRLKRIYRFERGSFFSCEHLKLLVKYMIGL